MTRRVLVTRTAESWPALAARFATGEIAVHLAPTTAQVDPVDPAPGTRALDAMPGCRWIVLTSANGVRFLMGRLAARGARELPRDLEVAAAGPATAAAVRAAGRAPDVATALGGWESLAVALDGRIDPGDAVLLVRPEGVESPLARALRARHAEVLEAPLYRTVAAHDAAGLARETIAGGFAGVALTAPSSMRLWLEAAGPSAGELRAALGALRRIAIGRTTAAYLFAEGLPAHATSDAPAEDAVADAIVRALSC